MKSGKPYEECPGKVIETGEKFSHVMAITLNPLKDNLEGIARCIVSRAGNVEVAGYVDRSQLFRIKSVGGSQFRFELTEPLIIKNQEEILAEIGGDEGECIGLEDPDVWIDPKTGMTHLYFTLPFNHGNKRKWAIHLGHAVGKDLDSLEMTMPVLSQETVETGETYGAKELSIAPKNKDGSRYNLVESWKSEDTTTYSVVRVAIANDMGEKWKYGDIVFHPPEYHLPWITGHASPGPLLPQSFIDVGDGKALGFMNGREANHMANGKTIYGMFSVGLFIYDYENGKIDWVSPEPFIQDSEAKTITFASQFVETSEGEGILYAHVDDSFVRAYMINAEGLRKILP